METRFYLKELSIPCLEKLYKENRQDDLSHIFSFSDSVRTYAIIARGMHPHGSELLI